MSLGISLYHLCLQCVGERIQLYSEEDFKGLPTCIKRHLAKYISAKQLFRLEHILQEADVDLAFLWRSHFVARWPHSYQQQNIVFNGWSYSPRQTYIDKHFQEEYNARLAGEYEPNEHSRDRAFGVPLHHLVKGTLPSAMRDPREKTTLIDYLMEMDEEEPQAGGSSPGLLSDAASDWSYEDIGEMVGMADDADSFSSLSSLAEGVKTLTLQARRCQQLLNDSATMKALCTNLQVLSVSHITDSNLGDTLELLTRLMRRGCVEQLEVHASDLSRESVARLVKTCSARTDSGGGDGSDGNASDGDVTRGVKEAEAPRRGATDRRQRAEVRAAGNVDVARNCCGSATDLTPRHETKDYIKQKRKGSRCFKSNSDPLACYASLFSSDEDESQPKIPRIKVGSNDLAKLRDPRWRPLTGLLLYNLFQNYSGEFVQALLAWRELKRLFIAVDIPPNGGFHATEVLVELVRRGQLEDLRVCETSGSLNDNIILHLLQGVCDEHIIPTMKRLEFQMLYLAAAGALPELQEIPVGRCSVVDELEELSLMLPQGSETILRSCVRHVIQRRKCRLRRLVVRFDDLVPGVTLVLQDALTGTNCSLSGSLRHLFLEKHRPLSAEAIANLPCLETLTLKHCCMGSLTDKEFRTFTDTCTNHPRLRELGLDYNNLGCEKGCYLLSSLMTSDDARVKVLNLGWNAIRGRSLLALCHTLWGKGAARGEEGCTTSSTWGTPGRETLVISGNKLRDERRELLGYFSRFFGQVHAGVVDLLMADHISLM